MKSVAKLFTTSLILTIVCVKNVHLRNKNGQPKRPNASFPQTPMMELLAQSIAPNIVQQNPGDLFDILRDKYPLPNGK